MESELGLGRVPRRVMFRLFTPTTPFSQAGVLTTARLLASNFEVHHIWMNTNFECFNARGGAINSLTTASVVILHNMLKNRIQFNSSTACVLWNIMMNTQPPKLEMHYGNPCPITSPNAKNCYQTKLESPTPTYIARPHQRPAATRWTGKGEPASASLLSTSLRSLSPSSCHRAPDLEWM